MYFSAEETNEPKFSNQLFVLPVIYTARIIIRGGGRDTIVHMRNRRNKNKEENKITESKHPSYGGFSH